MPGNPQDGPKPAISGSYRKGDDATQVPHDRPFLWSEIHSIANERIALLDAMIRKEIKKPQSPIPKHGAERSQFFLLLEEKANFWADRARVVYEDCLKDIGREDSFSARSTVYHNALTFFLGVNLRNFLYLECGCIVERPDPLRPPGQPRRTHTITVVPHDVGLRLTQIIDRVRWRIEKKFTRSGDWLAELQGLLRETQPQLETQSPRPNHPHTKEVPNVLPTTDGFATPPAVQAKGTTGPEAALLNRLRQAKAQDSFRTAEVATLLKISKRTVNRKVKNQELCEGPTRGTVTAFSVKKFYERLFGRLD